MVGMGSKAGSRSKPGHAAHHTHVRAAYNAHRVPPHSRCAPYALLGASSSSQSAAKMEYTAACAGQGSRRSVSACSNCTCCDHDALAHSWIPIDAQ